MTGKHPKYIPFADSADAGLELPGFADLAAGLRFAPKEGRIMLGNQRMLLLHGDAVATLRRELVESVGVDQARGLLTRLGYASGVRDAEYAATVRPHGGAFEQMSGGPALHALEGVGSIEPLALEIDVGHGHYFGEFVWRDSVEVDIHARYYGPSNDPVCWMLTGYAAGYASRFMGKQILYKEVECRGMGHRRCLVLGKPIAAWDDPAPEIYYMYPQKFAPSVGLRPTRRVAEPFADVPPAVAAIGDLVGASSGFSSVCHLLKRVADTRATVLFLGETGVGKERFARALHAASGCAGGPFVAVNCAAIPQELVESELFGVVKGAFTGATASRPGRFERAAGGSLFLDEVGSLSLAAQGKLLRVLQEREFERVGDDRTRNADVRVIAATNVNLREAVATGAFRDDLWFRLNVFPVEIPPLRERRDDIPLLMDHFLRCYTHRHGRRITGYTERAVDALLDYRFPGNIRELENMVERAVILAPEGSALDLPHLFTQGETRTREVYAVADDGRLREQSGPGAPGPERLAELALGSGLRVDELEAQMVLAAVAQANGNLAQAARLLGMTRRRLDYRYLKLTKAKPG
jgi:DNA-binding NtrC family response regulator/predicted hydrocarbon binding protein